MPERNENALKNGVIAQMLIDEKQLLRRIKELEKENVRLRDLVRQLAAALYSDCPTSVWKKLKTKARKVLQDG